jgi:RNA polymerase sigma-70 factor (ECF subfamily)
MVKSQTFSLVSNKQQLDDDRDLIEKAKIDPHAFEELYRRHVQAVYKYFYNRTWNQNEAEDLTEQTFMAALEGIQQYRENGLFLAWLFSIARRKAADHFRTKAKQTSIEIPDDIPVNSDFLNDLIQSERRKAIADIFNILPESEKELIRLRYVAELSFAEIGRLLHRSEGAVKKALYRIIGRMRKQLEEKYE